MTLIEIPFINNPIDIRLNDTVQWKIPKIIFQTWKSRQVPQDMAKRIRRIRELNPEYKYYFYGDNECRNSLHKLYPQENNIESVEELFDNIMPGAFKADLWRYCILAPIGGVYIDGDMILDRPLREILSSEDTFVTALDLSSNASTGLSSVSKNRAIYQAFLACTPQNPIMKSVRDRCISNLRQRKNSGEILSLTGPIMMRDVIDNLNSSKVTRQLLMKKETS
jgi:mannosyltransferase OCH1-like enzyme